MQKLSGVAYALLTITDKGSNRRLNTSKRLHLGTSSTKLHPT